eukprot:gb/GECG01013012.1/.p1 GENE.gb/GECG01013012.1/~~gb/GECG01013012.1/.p1  ORF type:complete len:1199 (+),score=142.70 gb/GECG01013012.1/:1-3597(+)
MLSGRRSGTSQAGVGARASSDGPSDGVAPEDHALFSDEYREVIEQTNREILEQEDDAELDALLYEGGAELLSRLHKNAASQICSYYIGTADPTSATPTGGLGDGEGIHGSLRNERNLWRLALALHEFDFGRSLDAELAASGGGASVVGMDCVQHDRRIIEAELSSNKQLQLMSILLRWLCENAEDKLRVHLPAKAAHELDRKRKEELRRVITENRPQDTADSGPGESSSKSGEELLEELFHRNEDGIVQEAQSMWFDTRRRKATRSSKDLDPDGPHRHLFVDSQVDEVATPLTTEDSQTEADILETVWSCLRAGRMQLARDICQLYGHPWRSALLIGGSYPFDGSLEELRSFGYELGNEFFPNSQEAVPNKAIESKIGNPYYKLWRQSLRNYARKLFNSVQKGPYKDKYLYDAEAAPSIIKLELAISSLLSLDVSSTVQSGLVHSWQDFAWVYARTALVSQLDLVVEHHKQKQRKCFEAFPTSPRPATLEDLAGSGNSGSLPYCFTHKSGIHAEQTSNYPSGRSGSSYTETLTIQKLFDDLSSGSHNLHHVSTSSSTPSSSTNRNTGSATATTLEFRVTRALVSLADSPGNLENVLNELDQITAGHSHGGPMDATISSILEDQAASSTNSQGGEAVPLGRSAPPTLITKFRSSFVSTMIPLRRFVALFVMYLRDFGLLRGHLPPAEEQHSLYSPQSLSRTQADDLNSEDMMSVPVWRLCDKLISRFIECLLWSSAPHKSAEFACRLSAPRAIRLYASILQRLPLTTERRLALRSGWRYLPGLMPNVVRTAAAGLSLPDSNGETRWSRGSVDAELNEIAPSYHSSGFPLPSSDCPSDLVNAGLGLDDWKRLQGLTLYASAVDASTRYEGVLSRDIWRMGADMIALCNSLLRVLFVEFCSATASSVREQKLFAGKALVFGLTDLGIDYGPFMREDIVEFVRANVGRIQAEGKSDADDHMEWSKFLKTYTEVEIILLEFEGWQSLIQALLLEKTCRHQMKSHPSSLDAQAVQTLSQSVSDFHQFVASSLLSSQTAWIVPFQGDPRGYNQAELPSGVHLDDSLEYRGAYVFKREDIQLGDDPSIIGRSRLPPPVSLVRRKVLPLIVQRLLELHEDFGMWLLGESVVDPVQNYEARVRRRERHLPLVSKHWSDVVAIADDLASEGKADFAHTLHYSFTQEDLDSILSRISQLAMKLMHLQGFA